MALNDVKESEGSTLGVSTTLPTESSSGTITQTEYAAIADFMLLSFMEDLPTADASKNTVRIPTVDSGEITVAGTTSRAEMQINLVAAKTDEGQKLILAAFKSGDPITCKITFSDGVIQYFTADVQAAQRSAPIGRANQLSCTLSVRGDVVEVVA